MKRFLFLFGRSPRLSQAELERLLETGLIQGEIVTKLPDGMILEAAVISEQLQRRLGGTIRIVELGERIETFLPHEHSGKFNFGFSYYHVSDWRNRRRRDISTTKELLGHKNIHSRFLDAKNAELPTASVRGNSLLRKGAEFIVYFDGQEEYVGKTVYVHDIEAYTSRDRARPSRDPKVGMLPPKLAQIMINLGIGPRTESIWDPLAGTGVILQEALLDGYRVFGSDSSTQMVESTQQNVDWIRSRFSGMPPARVFVHDIRGSWPKEAEGVDAVVTEGYLGRPISRIPGSRQIAETEEELLGLYEKFFREAATKLQQGSRIVVCFPFYRGDERVYRMQFIDRLLSNTYTLQGTYDYAPHGQVIGRQITVFEKV